jgi:hypothetical protein
MSLFKLFVGLIKLEVAFCLRRQLRRGEWKTGFELEGKKVREIRAGARGGMALPVVISKLSASQSPRQRPINTLYPLGRLACSIAGQYTVYLHIACSPFNIAGVNPSNILPALP